MRASEESPRMFENEFLDFFTRTPWWVVPLVWFPVVVWMMLIGLDQFNVAMNQALCLFASGWLFWTLTEYSLHRKAFHWRPDSAIHFFVHGVHHDWPNDRFRLVMPPAVSIVLAIVFGSIFHALLGEVWFGPFMSGFICGYLFYDVIHYATHHLKWANPVFQALKKHHLLHHHSPAHQDKKYGVSCTLWDHVFRTY